MTVSGLTIISADCQPLQLLAQGQVLRSQAGSREREGAKVTRGIMSDSVNLLMLQFLDWVASRPRTYTEAMDAWRTSCPRLSVWEDALIGGLIQVTDGEVRLTLKGKAIRERVSERSG
jgi:hypothetical protein